LDAAANYHNCLVN